MHGDAAMWGAGATATVGMAVLRFSWGRPTRSSPLNLTGFAALFASMVLADQVAGEWGVALAVLVAVGAALALLLFAACEPAPRVRARDVRTTHRGGDTKASFNRTGWPTFIIAGPLALAASVLTALALRSLILAGGGAEADGNVAVLAGVPIAWPVLTFALLMMPRRPMQLTTVLASAVISAAFILLFRGTA